MLKRLTQREQLESLLAEFEPVIQKAFLSAVGDLRSGVALGRVIEHLERREIDQAIDALNIDRAAYSSLEDAVRRAYSGGGQATTGGMPTLRDPNGAKVVIRFDAQATRAVEWVKQNSLAEKMVRIDKDAARVMIEDGIAKGRGARAVALNLAGRIDRATGTRSGGVIGLTADETRYVLTMREVLSDPARIREYFVKDQKTGKWKPRFTATDKRFNPSIIKAINDRKALAEADVSKITGRYSDILLLKRGTRIAKTEGMAAFNNAAIESYEQAIDRGAVSEADLEKTWRASMRNTRHTHVALNGTKVKFREDFVSPSGAVMSHPHDPDAPAAEVVNCECRLDITIDFLARFRRRT